jgi:hypothetical protein
MKKSSRPEPGFDAGYDGHQRRQARLGLELTPSERLQWLERKRAEMAALLGRARAPSGRTRRD